MAIPEHILGGASLGWGSYGAPRADTPGGHPRFASETADPLPHPADPCAGLPSLALPVVLFRAPRTTHTRVRPRYGSRRVALPYAPAQP